MWFEDVDVDENGFYDHYDHSDDNDDLGPKRDITRKLLRNM